MESTTLTLKQLTNACAALSVAIRAQIQLEPVGGPSDKIFPATHLNGEYAEETRIMRDDAGNFRECHTVLIDSVQSQANRLEQYLSAPITDSLHVPRIALTLNGRTITSLDAPHRVYDAFFHDSLREGKPFRDSAIGRSLVAARPWAAEPLFRSAPNALLFGAWDSRSNSLQSARFTRALVSEIVAVDAQIGKHTSSRICPIGIRSTEIYKGHEEPYTLDAEKAVKDERGKPLRLEVTAVGHSNIPPTIEAGGVTAEKIIHTAVISLTQLRQLRFGDEETSNAARAVLAALGLYAVTLQTELGYALRSRCLLRLAENPEFQLLGSRPADVVKFSIKADEARSLLVAAVSQARDRGLIWEDTPIQVEPAERLLALVARSEALARKEAE